MSFKEKVIGSIGVEDEGNWGRKTGITVKIDTLEKATIRFGDSFTLRINEEDLDELRRLLNTASVVLMNQRNEAKEHEEANLHAEEEMATEADEYDPEGDWAIAGGE